MSPNLYSLCAPGGLDAAVCAAVLSQAGAAGAPAQGAGTQNLKLKNILEFFLKIYTIILFSRFALYEEARLGMHKCFVCVDVCQKHCFGSSIFWSTGSRSGFCIKKKYIFLEKLKLLGYSCIETSRLKYSDPNFPETRAYFFLS